MHSDNNLWNAELILDTFLLFDSDTILSIPLGSRLNEDILIWHCDVHWNFSMKSAYRQVVELTKKEVPLTSNSSSSATILMTGWKFIRNCHVRQKVRVFAWKACHNDIPTLSNLARCNMEVVWALTYLPSSTIFVWPSDEEGWFRRVCYYLDPTEANCFLMYCWALWNNHNKALMDGKTSQAMELVTSADVGLHEFVTCSLRLKTYPRNDFHPSNWVSPRNGFIKVNFDGAVFAYQREIGAGVIAQNETRECLAWRTRSIDPTHAKTLPALEAL
ncbi:hypothetical protein Salat_1864200 [Sesamum alatum]|uniref:Reverse transcriptase zinc-binding domain-containing protein n=1 Tax=Sesamum alatum TaxID=300844 RepID=A0AAE1Y3X6_9LAMI|nr:hypothetical protein Salat_1864200 [Sesamum alatum]